MIEGIIKVVFYFFKLYSLVYQYLSLFSRSHTKGLIKGNIIPPGIVNAYFFSWIVIGKYVLLNLFIAMVLDGFSNKDVKK